MASTSTASAKFIGSIDRSMVERIVRQVALDYLKKDGTQKAPVLTVQTSSRHMHVCREDMDVLFGNGSELTFDRPLFQEGNFATKETVTIVGPRNRLDFQPAHPGADAQAVAGGAGLYRRHHAGIQRYSHPAFRRRCGHTGRHHHRPQRRCRVETGRDSCGHSRAHESGRSGAFCGQQGRQDEAADRRSVGPDV